MTLTDYFRAPSPHISCKNLAFLWSLFLISHEDRHRPERDEFRKKE
jgi:hypothetical protein